MAVAVVSPGCALGSAIVFLGLCILTGFTVGLFFLPAALALFVTAGFDLDQKQSAS